MTPHPLLLVHVVIEWPLDSIQIKSTKLKWISLNFIWFFPNGNDSIWKKNYSSLSWYDFFKNETTKPHCNSSTLNTDESRRSEDAVTTEVKKKRRRRKPDRGQEVLRLYTQVSLFKDQKSRLMIQRSGHCWSLCRKGLKYFLHTRVVFRFLSKYNFPCLNRKLLI